MQQRAPAEQGVCVDRACKGGMLTTMTDANLPADPVMSYARTQLNAPHGPKACDLTNTRIKALALSDNSFIDRWGASITSMPPPGS